MGAVTKLACNESDVQRIKRKSDSLEEPQEPGGHKPDVAIEAWIKLGFGEPQRRCDRHEDARKEQVRPKRSAGGDCAVSQLDLFLERESGHIRVSIER